MVTATLSAGNGAPVVSPVGDTLGLDKSEEMKLVKGSNSVSSNVGSGGGGMGREEDEEDARLGSPTVSASQAGTHGARVARLVAWIGGMVDGCKPLVSELPLIVPLGGVVEGIEVEGIEGGSWLEMDILRSFP